MKRIIMITAVILAASLILFYDLAIKKGRSVGEYTSSIDAMIFSGDYGSAVSECADGLKHYPESAELYLLKARAYMLSGDTEKAIGTLDFGYKQTQSDDILEQRDLIAEEFSDDVEFLPLTESAGTSEEIGGSSAEIGVSDVGSAASEPYTPDSPIRVRIPSA